MKAKTPQEKKQLDYDKQRRTHWDSQKAARKAVPKSKRAARQIIRKRSSELLQAPVEFTDDLPTSRELLQVEKDNRYRKYSGRRESLRRHVTHVTRVRPPKVRQTREPLWSVPIFESKAQERYVRQKHRRTLIDFLNFMDVLSGRKTIRKPSIKRDFEILVRGRSCPLLSGFLRDEPTFLGHLARWETRLAHLAERHHR